MEISFPPAVTAVFRTQCKLDLAEKLRNITHQSESFGNRGRRYQLRLDVLRIVLFGVIMKIVLPSFG